MTGDVDRTGLEHSSSRLQDCQHLFPSRLYGCMEPPRCVYREGAEVALNQCDTRVAER